MDKSTIQQKEINKKNIDKSKEKRKEFSQRYYQNNKERFKDYYQENKNSINEKRRLRNQKRREQKEQDLKEQLSNIEKRRIQSQENKNSINEKRRLRTTQKKKEVIAPTTTQQNRRGRPPKKALVVDVVEQKVEGPTEPNVITNNVLVGDNDTTKPYTFWTFLRDLFKPKVKPTPKLNMVWSDSIYMGGGFEFDKRRDVCSETIAYLMTTDHKEENLEYVQELIERLTMMRLSL
jgi:hypothetical protein